MEVVPYYPEPPVVAAAEEELPPLPPDASFSTAAAATERSGDLVKEGGGGGGISLFQGIMLGALVLVLLVGLLHTHVTRFLEWMGWLRKEEDEDDDDEKTEQQQQQQEELGERAPLHSGSSKDAVPMDVSASMDAEITGISLQPSFIDPSRGAVRESSARTTAATPPPPPPPPPSGDAKKSSSSWSASAALSSLFGGSSGGKTTAAMTSRQIGLMHSGRDSVRQPAAPRLEYTTFKPSGSESSSKTATTQ